MKEHPIIFTTELIPKILDGTKTNTRRVIKPQPHPNLDKTSYYLRDYRIDTKEVLQYCPYGQVGDRLWVREAYYCECHASYKPIIYKANGEQTPRWVSPLFMPRTASRITLEITGIRVERLQEIRDADCIAEGCPHALVMLPTVPMQVWFQHLWSSLNAKYSWESNPWVWVIGFKKVDCSE